MGMLFGIHHALYILQEASSGARIPSFPLEKVVESNPQTLCLNNTAGLAEAHDSDENA